MSKLYSWLMFVITFTYTSWPLRINRPPSASFPSIWINLISFTPIFLHFEGTLPMRNPTNLGMQTLVIEPIQFPPKDDIHRVSPIDTNKPSLPHVCPSTRGRAASSEQLVVRSTALKWEKVEIITAKNGQFPHYFRFSAKIFLEISYFPISHVPVTRVWWWLMAKRVKMKIN